MFQKAYYTSLREAYMSNATISDIAKKANVSIGTVSNVLNKKGNVKIETIRKVEEAAKMLSYVRNTNALSIRQKESTIIALVMPQLNDLTSALYTNLYHELILRNLTLQLYETNSNIETERECYRQINQQNCRAVFVVNPLDSVENLKSWLNDSTDLFALSPSAESLKFDLSKINKKIGNEKVLVVKDDLAFGFYKYFKDYKVIKNRMNVIYQELKANDNLSILVFDDKLASRISTILENMPDKNIKTILLTSKNIVSFKQNENKYVFHYSVNKIALDFLSLLDTPTAKTVNIYQTNYQLFQNNSDKSAIDLLMLETPFSKILTGLVDDFYSKYHIKVNIHTKSFSEMRTILSDGKLTDYDLIRLDISDFNWYGQKIFQSLADLPSLNPIISKLDNWHKYIYLDKVPYSIPLDPSVQMMLYQKDIFSNSILQKQFVEKYDKELLPPTTYSELADFSEFLSNLNIPEKDNYYPISLIDSAGTLIASEFLPYYYSIGGKIEYRDGLFHFNAEEFIQTYSVYQKIRLQSKIENKSWWDSETTDFDNKETALVIGFTNHLNNIDQAKYGIAPIPGNKPALGGGVIGIGKSSNKVTESTLFLQWLYQYQIQHEIALMGGDVPATDLFFEREIYEQFPFLSYSTELYSTGVRKTKVGQNQPINTLLFENIIGTEIYNGIQNTLDATDVLININNMLIKNIAKIIDHN